MYEGSTVPAYSADLDSPSHPQISQHHVITSSGTEQSSLILLSPDSHTSHQLQEKFPPLQPVNYFNTLPPTIQEPMTYQSFDSQQDTSKPQTSPTYMKSEAPEQDYQPVDYRTGSNTSIGIATDYNTTGMTELKASSYMDHGIVRHQAPQRYPASQSYGNLETLRTERGCFYPFEASPLEMVLPNQKPQVTKRGPFKDPQKRAKTAQVRKIGSCIRCRMQRIRVGITAIHSIVSMLTSMTVRI